MEIKAPEQIPKKYFLAGSIENGTAIDWQSAVAEKLVEMGHIVLNPRREEWDSTCIQSIDNPNFKEQVIWELDAMESADVIFIYFASETKAPISLLELGLYAKSQKLIVCCPDGFWRKGNVDIICQRYNILQYKSIDAFLSAGEY